MNSRVLMGFSTPIAVLFLLQLTIISAPFTPQSRVVPTETSIQFVDVTKESGIDFQHTNGATGQYYIMESIVGGLASFDFDSDGWIDILLLNSGDLPGAQPTEPSSNKLYRNNGDWTFTDVTRSAGLESFGYAMGLAVADYDNDGMPDIYVSNFGPNRLYRNNGDGTFADSTDTAAVDCGKHVGAGVCFFDIDGDGDLDLYAANYIEFDFSKHLIKKIGQHKFHAGPADFPPAMDRLFRNDGDGTFTDISKSSGIGKVAGYGMAVVAADFDFDFDTDLFVSNDGMANFYFVNDGNGVFHEQAIESGLAFDSRGKANSNMGVDCGDFNNDGLLDLFCTSYQAEMPILYQNLGSGLFEDVTLSAKIDRSLFPHVNWGIGFVDFDNDRDRDLYIACGHFMDNIEFVDDRTHFKEQNFLLSNQGNGTFQDITKKAGPALQVVESSRGAVFDDLDNDGDVDVVVLNVNTTASVQNNATLNNHYWCQVRLVGRQFNRDGVGAQVSIRSKSGTQVAQVHSGRGYQSDFGHRLSFGLGDDGQVERIEVRWGNGFVENFSCIRVNECNTLIEGQGDAIAVPRAVR